MENNWETFLVQMKKNPANSQKAIAELASKVDFKMPKDYLDFIAEVDGCEGMIGNTYLNLWRAEDLIEFNEKYRADEFAPGYFMIGSNLGGTAYAFNKENGSVVPFEFISILIDDEPSFLGANFIEFLKFLASS